MYLKYLLGFQLLRVLEKVNLEIWGASTCWVLSEQGFCQPVVVVWEGCQGTRSMASEELQGFQTCSSPSAYQESW